MKTIAVILAAILFAIATQASAAEGKDEIAHAVSNAKSVAILSLEPGQNGSRDLDGACAGYCYFGWPVLGQAAASSGSAKTILRDLSAWAAAPEPDAVAACFNPRHGVRVLANGHTYDFVVCFECAQAQVFKDSAAHPIAHFYYNASQESWDKLLSSAGVPLAAPAESDGS
jgi:hypothetical protein